MTSGPLSAETIGNFLYASTATVSMQMLKRGFRNVAVNGGKPLNPAAARIVGPAHTLRYIPSREDIAERRNEEALPGVDQGRRTCRRHGSPLKSGR